MGNNIYIYTHILNYCICWDLANWLDKIWLLYGYIHTHALSLISYVMRSSNWLDNIWLLYGMIFRSLIYFLGMGVDSAKYKGINSSTKAKCSIHILWDKILCAWWKRWWSYAWWPPCPWNSRIYVEQGNIWEGICNKTSEVFFIEIKMTALMNSTLF